MEGSFLVNRSKNEVRRFQRVFGFHDVLVQLTTFVRVFEAMFTELFSDIRV